MTKKPQLLRVVIGDRVEIGASTCVDRGSWRDTVIGSDTKVRPQPVPLLPPLCLSRSLPHASEPPMDGA